MKQMHGKMKLQRTKQYSLTLDFHAATFRDVLGHEIENKPRFVVHLSRIKVNRKTLWGGGGGERGSDCKGLRGKIGLSQQSFTFSAVTSQQFCRRLWLYRFFQIYPALRIELLMRHI